MNTKEVFEKYRFIVGLVEQEFDRNLRIYQDQILCGKGCSSCCSQMFRITLIDAALVSRSVKRLDTSARNKMQERATIYLREKKDLIRQRAEESGALLVDNGEEISSLGLRLPCPALVNDACSIYESRPLICRKYGIPLYDPTTPERLYACELNFEPGREIQDDELIERQTEIWEHWMELKTSVNEALNPGNKVTTIAEAILFDYDEMLKLSLSKPKEL